MKKYIVEGISDNGTKTELNQDSCFAGQTESGNGTVVFAAVCDGMGGAQSGELASATIIEEARNWFYSKCDLETKWFLDERSIRTEWTALLEECNEKILKYGDDKGIRLGSTAAFILITRDYVFIMNIGDTRIYELTDSMNKLNYDHSLVGIEIAQGLITEEQAKKDKRNNMLTQCVGMLDEIVPYFASYQATTNCGYIVCTDGFYNRLDNNEIVSALRFNLVNSPEELKVTLSGLKDMDRSRGERDDITVITVIVKEN